VPNSQSHKNGQIYKISSNFSKSLGITAQISTERIPKFLIPKFFHNTAPLQEESCRMSQGNVHQHNVLFNLFTFISLALLKVTQEILVILSLC